MNDLHRVVYHLATNNAADQAAAQLAPHEMQALAAILQAPADLWQTLRSAEGVKRLTGLLAESWPSYPPPAG